MKPLYLALAFLQVITYIGVEDSRYIGGTVSAIPQNALGRLDTSDESQLSFEWRKSGKIEAGKWRIPYDKVAYLGYGQHAGRRVGSTVGVSAATAVAIIPAVPLMWSKKRRHYLTVKYTDEQSKSQAAIFLVGKKTARVILATLEVRTGKKAQYEDKEATEAGNK